MSSILIVFSYLVQHLCSFLLLDKSKTSKYAYIIGSIVLYAVIYSLKDLSYDLNSYLQEIAAPTGFFEPGYYALTLGLNFLGFSPYNSLLVVRLILVFLFIYLTVKILDETTSGLNKLELIVVVISSVAFILGINNVLRQGFSSVLLLIAFYNFTNGKKITALLYFLLATSFHYSVPFFGAYLLMIFYITKMLFGETVSSIEIPHFSEGVIRIILFCIPIIAMLSFITIFQNLIFDEFMNRRLSVIENRTSALLKMVLIVGVFVTSEFLYGKIDKTLNFWTLLRFSRFGFVALVFWFSLNPGLTSLASRILYFYFMIEILLVVKGLESGKNWGGVLVLTSYAFALNAINILVGN